MVLTMQRVWFADLGPKEPQGLGACGFVVRSVCIFKASASFCMHKADVSRLQPVGLLVFH